jgi:hypothetical protein
MRKLSALLFFVLLALSSTGCDSGGNNEDSVSDKITGDWMLTSISDDEGDKTAVFTTGYNGIDISFESSMNFTIDVDAKVDAGDQMISGTWSVNETQSKLTLTASIGALPELDLDFNYTFSGDDVIALTATSNASTLLNTLLGTTLQGAIELTLARA